MANTLANLARQSSTTIGTGTLTLGPVVQGFNTFAAAGLTDGQTITYAIEDYSSDIPAQVVGREIGVGVYNTAGPTVTRTTVYSSTNGGSKINCTGRQHVLVTAAKEDFDSLALASDLTAHTGDTSGAHAASAISFSATGGIASTDVQAAIAELDSEKLSTSAAASTYQPLDSDLTTLAANITTFGHSLVDDADNTAARTTLGLGTAAVKDTGTSGNKVPLLDGANTWSGYSTYTANMLLQKASPVFQINGTSGDANGYISAVSGNGATFRWGTWTGSAFSERWLFGKDTTAESGSNAGSDFVIYRYSDAGGFLATLMSASRADGSVNWRGGLYSNGVTGGSKGNGTLNFGTLYEGGTSLAAKYSALASANTFTAAQTVSVDSAATNTVTTVATLRSTSTGTPAAGIGVALDFAAETAAGNNEIGARIGAVTTDVTSTSEDFDLVFSAMAAGAAVAERGRVTSKGTYKYPSFTVAGLPAGTAGETAFASNGRKNGEGAAAGTGVLVFHDGTAWRACDTGATVAA